LARIAFLGLGVMGFPMAGHLARAGHRVSVWNRTREKAAAWAEKYRGEVANDPAEAAWGREFVAMCLGDNPDVEAVFDQVEPVVGGGMVMIDHTTASPELARRLAVRTRAKGAGFLDAPVSGGQAGAEKGALTVMAGGEAASFEKARPVMQAYSGRITHIGESGTGQLAKCVNQVCIAGVLQGLSEGLNLAQASGLDVEKVIEAISGGAAQSWQMENRWKTMTDGEFDFGFAVDWMRKDLRIAMETAAEVGAPLPLAEMVDGYYAEVQAMGGARWDTSSLIARLKKD
jgi:3-hydroxyisobutyrate dehydrogenase-like beta-hydroxyacid dehydrogenase